MKFKNESDKLSSVQVIEKIGVRWITFQPGEILEVPEGYTEQALAHGLVPLKQEKVKTTPKEVKVEPVKKKTKKLKK